MKAGSSKAEASGADTDMNPRDSSSVRVTIRPGLACTVSTRGKEGAYYLLVNRQNFGEDDGREAQG